MTRFRATLSMLVFSTAASAAPTATVVLNFKQSFGYLPFEAPAEWGKNYIMAVPEGGHTRCSFGGRGARCGTVLRLEPPDAQHADWRKKVLWFFSPQPDGSHPLGSPVGDGHGNFFLTGAAGGSTGVGALIELSKPATAGQPWTEQVIHSFDASKEGAYPDARPHIDASGNVFLTLSSGGQDGFGYGALVEFSPPQAGQTSWTETLIHAFPSAAGDGRIPSESISEDAHGNLYLTAGAGGGPGQGGAVIEFSPPGSGGMSWTENVLYGFQAFTNDAAGPSSGVLADAQGNLYGTTVAGGTSGNGAVYELSPPSQGGANWTEKVLYSFSGGADGAFPERGIVMDGAGNLFVTAFHGGDANCGCGALIRLSPPQSGQGAWTETTLYTFQNGTAGQYPGAIGVEDSGNLLIPTIFGGQYSAGTLMEFSNTGYVARK